MLFSILEYPITKTVYSYAIIIECTGLNTYKAKFKQTHALVYTKNILNTGDWIRFYGKYDGRIIKCEYVEVLNGIDINLITKLLDKTK